MNVVSFKKTNVFLVVLLSNLTLGLYIPYWFIARKKAFNEWNQNQINFTALNALFIVYLFLLFYNLLGFAFLTDYGKSIFDSIDLILTSFGLGIMYFSVFRAKEVIEDGVGEEFNFWLLLFFHIWYLQYKINRLDFHREQTPLEVSR
ncbi:hypothetical protein LS684_02140 [Cytobacillus spongiae]|jgi:hypothetical protein|uniref:hypothetical protein n=1 Tax=Cytobacillus spongiae TaxID=2901381 RepID=UPI001F2B5F06|nr:hypothetical protein [Cytobacillus spongiae]UII56312.1 hypothetical protein LS684_02140 [Cytobacillus spongiae]